MPRAGTGPITMSEEATTLTHSSFAGGRGSEYDIHRSPSSSSMERSSSRFTTNVSDFQLPLRTGPIANTNTTPIVRNDGEFGVSSTTLPLLRRAAAAAAFANANSRSRLRRGSMLGREVPKDEGLTSSEEDEDMSAPVDKSPSPNNDSAFLHKNAQSDQDTLDDDMQIETGDVSLENVKLESRSRPSTPPPHISSGTTSDSPGTPFELGKAARGGATRRGAGRSRGNQGFRDRGVQRVAASLRDEARPSDSEIASEAKLQRKLAPESESITPNTPRLLAVGARSPVALRKQQSSSTAGQASNSAQAFDDDDLMFHDHFDPYDGADSSDDEDFSSASAAKVGHTSSLANVSNEEESEVQQYADAIAIPGAATSQREKLWLGFRESTPVIGLRASPGSERVLGKGRPMPMSGPGNGLSSSYGSPSLDTAMDAEHFVSAPMRPGLTMASPSLWGKTTKRKHEADRYEPYSASLHKRRAVSPTTIASAGTGSGAGHSIAAAAAVTAAAWQRQRARSSTPTTTAQSPLLQAISQQQSPLLTIQTNNTMGYFNNLPMPTPLSIPSPTLSVTRAMSGTMNGVGGYLGANAQSLSKSLPLGVSNNAARMNVTNSNGSTINASESPSSTRPSTPTNIPLPATRAGTTTNGGGSGPGYGSGALGLSLGSGTSKKFKQEQEEQEEQEDMLDDVNAIRLGEK
ncbi:hypothetical protein L7F22_052855 [Adiantum nelumboides]|nr:hypothetical protein [Adiantum nelumboides]